jgi:hypothetical protein
MGTPPLSPETHAIIWYYLQQGLPYRQIRIKLAREHGEKVSLGTICNVNRRMPAPRTRYTGKGIRSDKKVGEVHWREWVPTLQKMQALKKKGSFSQDHAFIELGDGTRPVALASFSDQHMGAWSTSYELLQRFTDELLETNDLYIALLGDYGQYSIKLRGVLEVSDNLLPPEQQTQFIESWFSEIWHKVAFATWDNHAVQRQENQAGESSIKKMLSRRVVYFNGIGHVNLKVGNQLYPGAVSHRFRGQSMLNPVHSAMRYGRFEGTDREWFMQGDTHVPGMAKYTDGDKTRVAINAGSIQLNSGFGKRYFSLTTHPVYPILVFYPDRHEISPFWSIKEWLAARTTKR